MQTEVIIPSDLARAEARLPRWMTAMALSGSVAFLLAGHWRAAVGFALGASLAILNYFWLHQAVESLFAASRTRLPRMVVAKFVVRYPLAFGGFYLFFRTGWLPFGAILAGLFVPVAGILVESGFLIRDGLK